MGLTRPRAHQIFDIDYKQAVRVITTSNITLSGGAPLIVDGVTLTLNDRVLVTGQSTGSQNGLYYVTTVGTGSNGTWARSIDGNETGEIQAGMIVMVTEGSSYADSQWKLTTNDPITIGVSALTFEQSSAYAFGTISANSTSVVADTVGDTVTFTPGNNFIITGNASTDTITFSVTQSPSFTGTLSVTGNANVGNLGTAGLISATGNITGGNLITAGLLTATGNVTGGNLITIGLVTATGNVTGANFNTAGLMSATGNISTGTNIFVAGYANVTNTVTAGNVDTGGRVSATGNITGGNLITSGSAGNISGTGNITAGNLISSGIVSATGNITGGNLVISSNANVGQLVVNGNTTITGHVVPSANVAYDLGTPTQRWRSIYVGANTIDIGGATISANLTTGSLILTGPDGAEFVLSGTSATTSDGAFGYLTIASNAAATSTTTGAITVLGGMGVSGNIFSGGLLSVVGNVDAGNLRTAGQVSAVGNIVGNYILGNITFASGYNTTKLFNGTSEANIGTSGGNANISIGGTSNVAVFATTGEYVTGVVSASGNITGGNLITDGLATVTGNITGGNINTPGVITATGNIVGGNITTTGIGTIGTLSVSGNALIAGNLTVDGNVTYINISDLNVEDPIIGLGRGPNNSPLSTNDGKDRGEQLWYYTTSEQSGFIGYDNSAGKLIAASNVSIANEIVTVNSYGTFVVGTLEGSIASVSGNITGGNLNTSGLITATGNITGGNLNTSGLITATGNITGGNLITAGTVYVTTNVSATGNVRGGNINTAGIVSASGNITGSYILANGSQLTGVNTFSTLAVTAGNTITADSIADTLTFTAGAGISIVADASSDTITIATSSAGSEIFVDGADFGTVAETVTTSDDLGLITDALTSQSDLGEIVVSGVFYPNQLVFPSYTVAGVPSASPAGQMIYVTNESGGAVPAFSDGTNWRRVTDRAIIT